MARPKNPAYEYVPNNKGVPIAHVRIVCEQCGEGALVRADSSRRFCSKSCAVLQQHADGKVRQVSGSEHYAWKGSDAKYQALHNRVIRLRGRADHCEWRQRARCSSRKYEWAHLHGTDPGDPQNYVSLCKTCHQRYDHQTGPDHTLAKLTSTQVADIRRRYAAGGISQSALGFEYGIDQKTVSNLVRGKSYKAT